MRFERPAYRSSRLNVTLWFSPSKRLNQIWNVSPSLSRTLLSWRTRFDKPASRLAQRDIVLFICSCFQIELGSSVQTNTFP